MRVLTAAIVGGVIVFIWSAIAHIATPLGTMGINIIPNEDALLQSMKATLPQSGLYFFPSAGIQPGSRPSAAQQKLWDAKFRSGPSGIVVYTAGGTTPMSAQQLGFELLTNVLCGLIAALFLTMMIGTYMNRVTFVALLAVFASFSITASYVVWYRFPASYFVGELVTELIGWFLAGLAMAKIIPPVTLVTSDVAPGT